VHATESGDASLDMLPSAPSNAPCIDLLRDLVKVHRTFDTNRSVLHSFVVSRFRFAQVWASLLAHDSDLAARLRPGTDRIASSFFVRSLDTSTPP
jgi:hypothetical protein